MKGNVSHMQMYYLSEEVLWRLVGQGTYPEAQSAYERFQNIKKVGGSPRCFYNSSNGFSVLDEDNSDQMRRCLSLEQGASPFPI